MVNFAEVNISPKLNISAHTPKMALHENPAPPGSWIVIFLHGPKKKAIFLHIVVIFLHGTPKKAFFYAQLNKKLAKSALYNIIPCFAFFSMI